MAHPYHHSLSSVKKWGGVVADYQPSSLIKVFGAQGLLPAERKGNNERGRLANDERKLSWPPICTNASRRQ
jgi:hypothetical protein